MYWGVIEGELPFLIRRIESNKLVKIEASIFTSLFDSILRIRNGNSPSITPQYKLAFSVGAGGKVVNTASGFECESECEVVLTDVLRATYEAS